MRAGPPWPPFCLAKGAGLGGGTAGQPVTLTVECFDAGRQRVRDGGALVDVSVRTTSGSAVEARVLSTDAGDGIYAVTYTVPTRGDFSVCVKVNGEEVQGSPFAVFFAAGVVSDLSLPPVQLSAAASLLGGVRAPCNDFQNGKCFRADCRFAHDAASTQATHAASTHAMYAASTQATLHVGNLSPLVSIEQLRQLFAYCGSVIECRIAGDSRQFAFVEFARDSEAATALNLNGMMVGDRPLKVELAKTARLVRPAGHLSGAPVGPAVLPNIAMQHQLAYAQAMQAQAVQASAVAASASTDAAAAARARMAEINARLQSGPDRSRDRSRDRSHDRSRSREREHRRRHRSRSRSRDREHRGDRSRGRDSHRRR